MSLVRAQPEQPKLCPGVAQSGSAFGLGPKGREFKSLHPDQYISGCAEVGESGWSPKPMRKLIEFESLHPCQ